MNRLLVAEIGRVYEENADRIENPRWEIKDGKLYEPKYVHDYEAYIPEVFKFHWEALNQTLRTSMFMIAEAAADAEVWD